MPHTPNHKKKKKKVVEKKPNEVETTPQSKEKTRIFSRPTGTPKSENVDITDLTPSERRDVQQRNAIGGQLLRERAVAERRAEVQKEINAPIIEQQEREAETIRQDLGTTRIEEGLTKQIENPQDISPQKTQEDIQRGQREFIGKLVTGKASKDEILKEIKNFAKGLGVASVVGGAVLSAPFIATSAAGTAIATQVTSASTGVKVIAGGLIAEAFGGKVTDINRNKINTMKARISGITEDGERIEASVGNGLPPEQAIAQLQTMIEAVDDSEQALKTLAITNLKYRVGKEYIADSDSIISARTSMRRRIQAIENIAIQGSASLNPEALILNASQIGGQDESRTETA